MTVDLTLPGGHCDARVFGDADQPGVLMLMDVFGPRPCLDDLARAVAARGYRVLVPNLFWRLARPPYVDPFALMRAHAFTDYLDDAKIYLSFFAGAPVRLIGYCLGGNVALRVAAAFPDRVPAVVGAHVGQLVTADPDSPHRQVARITAEVYLAHADEDPSMTPSHQAELARAFDEAAVNYRAEVYPGARHGFTMADRPVFDAAARDRHLRETFAVFDRTRGKDSR